LQTDDPLAALVKGRPVNVDVRSTASFDLMVNWLETCQNQHSRCSIIKDQPLPLRVIDVGVASDSHPRLFVTNGMAGSWTTLSHCWGGKLPLTTTAATIVERQNRIPLENFPPTFKDAIFLTRKLGFRYIWIDSLCIIQDSREDWSIESTRMGAIYEHAALNISASAARDAADGIFASSDKERHFAFASAVVRCFSNIHKIQGIINIRQHTNIQPPESNLHTASSIHHLISLV
jgi:hypothetical protein